MLAGKTNRIEGFLVLHNVKTTATYPRAKDIVNR